MGSTSSKSSELFLHARGFALYLFPGMSVEVPCALHFSRSVLGETGMLRRGRARAVHAVNTCTSSGSIFGTERATHTT